MAARRGAEATPYIRVLDGGMGTLLEAKGHDVSGAMWGSELVQSRPEVISEVHDLYLAAGSDLIETATYQMTPSALAKQYPNVDVKDVLQKAISLAASASPSVNCRPHGVALSLGPFGSTLSPGQEYAGVYPSPYGPPASPNATEQSLYEFHLQRLAAFEACPAVNSVRWLAFETVPSLAEIKAIRRSVADSGLKSTPFWVASAFPNGSLGEAPNGPHGVSEWLDALLQGNSPVPDGVGINCTNPAYLTELLDEIDARVPADVKSKLTLLVYPDGGCVYDVVSRTWTEKTGNPNEWARGIVDAVKERKGWKGVIVGGCCKTGPEEIAALRKEVDKLQVGH